ncbi:CBS domain-containing protein [Pseudonocardia parietis]|uniref:CBS domain-containing protein n=1 Tax=Pseudonocardia parietis TaxID=570936 RepID=A0ABS4VW52_9PSEU|nr:CBS domain-containing protein [Pseudonocardia parietis]MBP2368158.1 CBS domain-containing protein [Pseudonocardia parietis]
MRAADVMTAPAVTVPAATPVPTAAALLASHGFTAAPVLDGEGHLIGIVTEADLARNRIRPEGWPEQGAGLPGTVGEVMTRAPLAMRPEDDLADVVTLMLDAPIRSVPIVDDGVVVGVVTRRDVLRVVARGELTSAEVRARRPLPTRSGGSR